MVLKPKTLPISALPTSRKRQQRDVFDWNGQVLCTTSTLAVGVNLPARLVVLKGTRRWGGDAGHEEYERSTCLQMMGRAGRPQFDTHGTAVILTQASVGLPHMVMFLSK